MPVRPLSTEDLDHVLAHTRDVLPALRGARIFITGGTGFFGHSLVESLLQADRQLSLRLQLTLLTRSVERFREQSPHIASDAAVSLLQGDITSFSFPPLPHTHVIHAATDSGGTQAVEPPFALAETILAGTRRVLEFAGHTGARRLLYTSSGAVYGRSSSMHTHTPETCRSAPDPLSLQSSYDEAKRMSEHLCIAYAHGTSLQPVITRPFAFVGPHLPLHAHFAIGNFIGAALSNEPLRILGDGTPLRSWLYTADLSIWLIHLLLRGAPGRAYNVGSEDAHTIADAAHLTARTLRPSAGQHGSTLTVQIDGVPTPGAPMNSYVPSTARVREELGLRETISLRDAIRRTAAWHGYTASPSGD